MSAATRRNSLQHASLILSACSLLLACANILLGRRVNYLHYLPFFNVAAATMLALCVAALIAGVASTWMSRGRSVTPWLADTLAVLILVAYLFDR